MKEKKKAELLEKWQTFYKKNSNSELLVEVEFDGMAIGFFCALGTTIKEAKALYNECISMGCF